MKPRLRLVYTAVMCSFVPYSTKLAFETYTSDELVHTLPCSLLASLNAALLTGLCLSWHLPMVASGAVIGASYGTLYSLALK